MQVAVVGLVGVGKTGDFLQIERFMLRRNDCWIGKDVIHERRAGTAGEAKPRDLNRSGFERHGIQAGVSCMACQIDQDIDFFITNVLRGFPATHRIDVGEMYLQKSRRRAVEAASIREF